MKKQNKTSSGLTNWLNARVVTAFTVVGVAFGSGYSELFNSDPSPRKAQQEDPISLDGPYATWSELAASIECKAQRQGMGPLGEAVPFHCTPFFAAALTNQALQTDGPNETSGAGSALKSDYQELRR